MYWPSKSGRGPVNLTILGNARFVNNIAGDNGGAIYASGRREYGVDNERATVAHLDRDVGGSAVFSSNNALGSYGGAISIEGQGTLAIHGDVRLQGNIGIAQAGAVHVNGGSEAKISGRVVIDNNYAPIGGALCAYGSTIQLSGSVSLINNSAQMAGGGIIALVVNSALSTIAEWARIENNQADSEGGAVFVSDSFLAVSGMAVFGDNRAGGSGGAIAARASASVRVSGAAALVGNTVSTVGGAIDVDTSVIMWLDGNSSVKFNRAANGGGLSVRSVAHH